MSLTRHNDTTPDDGADATARLPSGGQIRSFERVFVLNLSRRPDRWDQFRSALPGDWPFRDPERVAAIDGSSVQCPDTWRSGDGAWGCYRTHLKILETCLNERIESVLILEDDAICCKDFARQADLFMEHLPGDWSLLYLGGQHLECGRALPLRVNDYVYRPFNVNRCHAYALRGRDAIKRVYHHVLCHDQWGTRHHIDHRMGELHKEHPPGVYVPRQWLVQQREGQSDINGNRHDATDFPGAEVLARERIDQPFIAVLGVLSEATETLASILSELGVQTRRSNQFAAKAGELQDDQLRDVCHELFSAPLYLRTAGRAECVRKLRRWAAMHCYALRHARGYLSAYHPALCLLGPELLEAWPDVRFLILMDSIRPLDTGNEADRYLARTLISAREQFLRDHHPQAMRVGIDDLTSNPAQVRRCIETFLQRPNESPPAAETATSPAARLR